MKAPAAPSQVPATPSTELVNQPNADTPAVSVESDSVAAPWVGVSVSDPTGGWLWSSSRAALLGDCPNLWPVAGPVIYDMAGEGLEDFMVSYLELDPAGSFPDNGVDVVSWRWVRSMDVLARTSPDLYDALPSGTTVEFADGSIQTTVDNYDVFRLADNGCVFVLGTFDSAARFRDDLIAGIREVEPS